jgi:glycosyltransferase involved in cell wall biosynthesis
VPQKDLALYINCMDVLALPSLTAPAWKEQYGRVIAEAFACGVPVVGSDSGATPEVAGDAGVIVKEGDSAALAEALRSVLFDGDMASQLRQRALARARNELSASVMAQRLDRLYRSVLNN